MAIELADSPDEPQLTPHQKELAEVSAAVQNILDERVGPAREKLQNELGTAQGGGIIEVLRGLSALGVAIQTLATPGINPIHKVQIANAFNNQITERIFIGLTMMAATLEERDADEVGAAKKALDRVTEAWAAVGAAEQEIKKMMQDRNRKAGPAIILPGQF